MWPWLPPPLRTHRRLADRYKIPRVYSDYKELAKDPEIEAVTITAPNALHCEMTVAMAQAGKHVICEKPLCVTLDEADRMIEACRANGVLLLYAEELFFTPKYRQGERNGRLRRLWQSAPHQAKREALRSARGVVLGCEASRAAGRCSIWAAMESAFAYWFLGRPKMLSAYSHLGTYVHGDKTQLDDEAVTIIEFEGNAFSIIENSWARRGGMDDRIEIYGEGGLTIANLHMGNALPTYSEYGFGYAVEKAPTTTGWTYPVFEELWNYGFPQEMRHFARAIRGLEAPQATGEDGKVVLEAIYRRLRFRGPGAEGASCLIKPTAERPVDEWLNRRKA